MASTLETVTRHAGAVPSRSGVAAHYGSPAGELAVCVRAVGLADRSHLVKLEINGPEGPLADLVHRVTARSIAPRGCVRHGAAWSCAASRTRVVMLAEPTAESLLNRVRATAPAGVAITDRSTDWSAIALVGQATLHVLGELGLIRNPRLAPPFDRVSIGGVSAELLLQSERRALFVVPAATATEVWKALEEAGHPYGMSCVGTEAVTRFELLERRVSHAPTWATA